MKSSSLYSRQKGLTLVELMVAVLIGLLAMYAVYMVYEGTERTKRNIASLGAAQVDGLYALFLLEQHIHNAGFGFMRNSPLSLLVGCDAGDVGGNVGGGGLVTRPLTLRPLPVVIDPNPSLTTLPVGNFDDVYVFFGSSSLNMDPVSVSGVAGGVTVATPFGFRQNHVLVDTTPPCRAYLVPDNTALINLAAPAPRPTSVTLNLPDTPVAGADLVDLGIPVRRHFYVNDQNTLLMEDWRLNPDGTWTSAPPSPIISGVVSFRAQYGIGNLTGALDSVNRPIIGPVNLWTFATAPWDTAAFQVSMTGNAVAQAQFRQMLRQIKAVRISIIVRADEPESNSDVAATLPTTFTQFADCPGDPSGAACPQTPVTPPALPAGWRYRMYETVIPLKNTIWN